MAKKNKGNRRGQNPPPQAAPKPVQAAKMTAASVAASPTEAAFEKNKDALISKFMEEIELLESERKNAEDAAGQLRSECEALKAECARLIASKDALQDEYDGIQEDYERATATIERVARAVTGMM